MNSNGSNLVDELHWIPVTLTNGEGAMLPLAELYGRAEQVADFTVTPAQRVALMRLLLCITQRALDGPQTRRAWQRCREEIVPRSLAYLKQWKQRFNLYGGNAFLQPDGLEETGNATLDKFDFTRAAGDSHTLWDHLAVQEGREYSAEWQALTLLTFQNFTPGGRIGETRWNGVPTSGSGSSSSSPSLEGSPLHLFWQGENLLETLFCNLLPFEELSVPVGVPLWERFPKRPGDCGENCRTYLGRLLPLSRAVKLRPGSRNATLANGLVYPQLPEYADPLLVRKLRIKEETPYYLAVSAEKHPWRELGSILALHEGSGGGAALNLLNRKYLPKGQLLRLWCGGVGVDKAKFELMGEWSFALLAGSTGSDETVMTLKAEVERAEKTEKALRDALKRYLTEVAPKVSSDGLCSRGKTLYWQRLDAGYDVLIATTNSGDAGPWRKLLYQCAVDVLEKCCPLGTARHVQAFTRAKGLLNYLLRPVLNDQREGKE